MATKKEAATLTAAVYLNGELHLPGDPVPEGVTFSAAAEKPTPTPRDVVMIPGTVDVPETEV